MLHKVIVVVSFFTLKLAKRTYNSHENNFLISALCKRKVSSAKLNTSAEQTVKFRYGYCITFF